MHKYKYSLLLFFVLVFTSSVNAVVKNWVSGANWQTATWSPAGVPTAGDDVFVSSTNFNIDGSAVCGSLSLNATTGNARIDIVGTLLISGTTGNFAINSLNTGNRFTITLQNAGSTLTVNGAVSYPSNAASRSSIIVNSGAIFTSNGALLLQTRDRLTINAGGIANCNGGLTDGAGSVTLFSGSRINFGTKYEVQTTPFAWPAGSIAGFNANTTVSTSAGGSITFANVELNSGTVTLSNIISVAGTWTNNGGALSAGANTVTFTGNPCSIEGTGSTTFGPLAMASGAVCTMNNSNSATAFSFVAGGTLTTFNQANGTIFTVNGVVTLNQPTGAVVYNWNINNATATVSGLINFAGATNNAGRIARITIANGILNANGGMTFVASNAASKQIVMSGGTLGIINLRGALTVPAASSTLTAGTSSTFNYCDPSVAQTVNYFSAGAYNNLTFNNTSVGGATLSAAITAANVTGNLSVQTGLLVNGTFPIAGNAAKIFSVLDGATFRLTGTSVMPTGFGAVSLGVTSTCDFNGVGAQTIAAHNYGNLTSSSTGTRTLVSFGIIGVANVFTPGTNVFTITGSTIDFNGTGAQAIPTFTYNNLTTSVGGTKTLGGAIVVNNDLTISSPTSLDVSASNFGISVKRNWINNSSFVYRAGTVSFTGSAAQSISGTTTNVFYNISLIPAAAGVNVSANNALNVINDLTFDATAGGLTLTTNGNVTLKSSSGQTARVASIVNNAGLTISGNLNIERFAPGGKTGWTIMGNPGITGLSFTAWDDDTYITCAGCPDGYNLGGTNFCSVQTYSETVGGLYDNYLRYGEIASINDPMTIGQGYWVYFGDGDVNTNNILLDASGSIFRGNLTIPLTVTGGASDDHGWNLLANPYPSPISWDLVRNGNANVDAEIQVYNPDFGAHSSYAGGVGTNGLSNTGAIPMGQAFYVHATAATSLNFTETVKSNTQSALLRLNGQNQTSNASVAQQVVRIKLRGGPYNMQDETVLHFNSNASNGWDGEWDAHKLAGYDYYSPSISSVFNGIDYSINAIPLLNGTVSFPLLAKTGATGTYTISIAELVGIPSGACIQLYDRYTSTTHDIKSTPYVCSLSDTITVPRFDLIVTLTNGSAVSTNIIQPTCPNNGIVVASVSEAGPWNYYWRNETGLIVKTSLNKSTPDSLTNLSAGIFQVEVNSVGSCNNSSASILINSVPEPVADFVVLNDTVVLVNGIAGVDFINSSLNANSFVWNFDDGTSSGDTSPHHDYVQEGVYEVELISSLNGCSQTNNIIQSVYVISEPLQINASVTNLSCGNKNEGKIVAIGSNSGPWNYIWFDGGGNIIKSSNSILLADSIENLSAGVYTLRMRTIGAANETEEIFYIESPLSPQPSFTINSDTFDLSQGSAIVNFTNLSSNADSYYWDFGGLSNSQIVNPSHEFLVAGNYIISLYAYHAACGDSVASYEVIEVIDAIVGLKENDLKSNALVTQNSNGEVFVKFAYENPTPLIISTYNTLGAKITQDISLTAKEETIKLNIPEIGEQLLLIEIKADNHTTVVEKIVRRKY